jgi:toxin ParE1/3/4
MAYRVNVAARAERDLAELYDAIRAQYAPTALDWYEGLKEAILNLENFPYRHPLLRKRDKLRHLLYGHKPHIYRVIYRVSEETKRVVILHIRHGARRRLKSSDLA